MDRVAEPVRADDGLIEGILATLREHIGPQKYNAWFRHGTRVSLDNGRIKVAVPNPFVANWIETHYQGEIAAIVEAATGKKRSVMVTVDTELCRELRRHDLDSQADLVAKATEGRSRPRRRIAPPPLRHRLEGFVVGESNKLAYTAAVAVTSAAKPPFNPLFVHGSCGVGKTHLLQGICNAAQNQTNVGCASWRYVTGEQFTNEFIQAVRNKSFHDFRRRYRKLDLLAIDDIHFLAAKKSTQEEFLHTFNAIESAGKQIILSSDTHPNLVGRLNPQLLSRFVAGMVVKIDPPDHATRVEILTRRAGALRLHARGEVLEYIATHIRGSVRELEGALIRLAAVASLENNRPTLALARAALADYLVRTDSAITLGDIEAQVATYFGITPAELHSSRRTRTVSLARMITAYLARRHTTMSFPEIGRAMGKNHSSIVLAVQRLEALLAGNESVTWTTPMGPKSASARDLADLLAAQLT